MYSSSSIFHSQFVLVRYKYRSVATSKLFTRQWKECSTKWHARASYDCGISLGPGCCNNHKWRYYANAITVGSNMAEKAETIMLRPGKARSIQRSIVGELIQHGRYRGKLKPVLANALMSKGKIWEPKSGLTITDTLADPLTIRDGLGNPRPWRSFL